MRSGRDFSVRMRLSGFGVCAAWLGGLSGKRRHGAAFMLGMLSVLALPPVYAVPALLLSFPGLLWLLDGAEGRRAAFAVGWWFGWGHWIGGLYWLACALLIDPLRFGWMIPFAVGGIAAVAALYAGATTLATQVLAGRGIGRIAVFAGVWTVFEMVRGVALTGFAWNPMGHVWAFSTATMQPAAWIGVYGLSLVTVFAASLPAALGWDGKAAPTLVASGFAALAVLFGIGSLRLPAEAAAVVEGVRLRLVQPAIPQAMKWEVEQQRRNLEHYVELSVTEPKGAVPTHVLWGETAVPFVLNGETDAPLRSVFAGVTTSLAANAVDAALLTGIVRTTPPGQPRRLWNSLAAFDANGTVRASYDKAHLVPFGEYIPFRRFLPLRKITPGAVDYSPGPGLRTLELPGLPPFGPLVCYEIIFPGKVVNPAERRPAWLLNATNDGWYGISAGPYQHLVSAEFRAVEEGVPLVRIANSGISVVTDSYGRETGRIGLGKEGVLDVDLPQALPETTLFARVGLALPLGLAFLAAIGGMLLSRWRGGR